MQKQPRTIKSDEGLIRSCGQGKDLVRPRTPCERKNITLQELEQALAHFALNENLSSFSD